MYAPRIIKIGYRQPSLCCGIDQLSTLKRIQGVCDQDRPAAQPLERIRCRQLRLNGVSGYGDFDQSAHQPQIA